MSDAKRAQGDEKKKKKSFKCGWKYCGRNDRLTLHCSSPEKTTHNCAEVGTKPCKKHKKGMFWWVILPFWSFSLPPDRTPLGSMPVGVSPFSVSTLSLSSLKQTGTFSQLPVEHLFLFQRPFYLPHIIFVDWQLQTLQLGRLHPFLLVFSTWVRSLVFHLKVSLVVNGVVGLCTWIRGCWGRYPGIESRIPTMDGWKKTFGSCKPLNFQVEAHSKS